MVTPSIEFNRADLDFYYADSRCYNLSCKKLKLPATIPIAGTAECIIIKLEFRRTEAASEVDGEQAEFSSYSTVISEGQHIRLS
jgi:hypothetical protein